jgi:peptidoglycan/xylan/chitin deacetylase (PgdA/CDA1 family)
MSSKASIITLILVIMFAITILSSNSITTSYSYSPCNCVIFVLDDIGDQGFNNVQVAITDYFISKNMQFTASIVANEIGNASDPDTRVRDKVKEGIDKKLFEIAIHGNWHINHSLLTKEEQKDQLIKANERLEYLFGKRADIFIPPFNEFNLHTIEVMSELNIGLLSTTSHEEKTTINPYNSHALVETNNSKIEVSRISDQEPLVYYAPVSFSILSLQRNGLFGDDLVREALRLIDEDIAKYGFAQVRLHPSDFAQLDTTTGKRINKVDDIKFQELTKTVDSLAARNIKIASFAEIYSHSR